MSAPRPDLPKTEPPLWTCPWCGYTGNAAQMKGHIMGAHWSPSPQNVPSAPEVDLERIETMEREIFAALRAGIRMRAWATALMPLLSATPLPSPPIPLPSYGYDFTPVVTPDRPQVVPSITADAVKELALNLAQMYEKTGEARDERLRRSLDEVRGDLRVALDTFRAEVRRLREQEFKKEDFKKELGQRTKPRHPMPLSKPAVCKIDGLSFPSGQALGAHVVAVHRTPEQRKAWRKKVEDKTEPFSHRQTKAEYPPGEKRGLEALFPPEETKEP